MKPQPSLYLLVEADPCKLVARVTQHHHEHVGLAQSSLCGIVDAADIAEVHLRFLPRNCLERDCHVFGAHTSFTKHSAAQPLHSRQA